MGTFISAVSWQRNHYPAIDILRSVSRVASQVCLPEHLHSAGEVRRIMAKIEELQIFLDLGEYKAGENTENDRAINRQASLSAWLCQKVDENSVFSTTLGQLHELAS